MRLLWVVLFVFITTHLWSQQLSTEEQKLYDLVMQYRKELGLPAIPFSPSLTFVAQTHVKDLAINRPDQGSCNTHSWSSNGKWSPVCYTKDHRQAQKMWNKPSELTDYKGKGYEIATMIYGTDKQYFMTATMALKSWKGNCCTQCSNHQFRNVEKLRLASHWHWNLQRIRLHLVRQRTRF